MPKNETGNPRALFQVLPEDYAVTFSGVIDCRTLTHILAECHFFRETMDPEEMAQRNMGLRILRNLGAIRPENYLKITAALIKIALDGRIEEKGA